MSSEADRFWDEIAGKLRKKKGFCPLTPKEAEAAYNAAPDVPLPGDRIASIVRAATTGETEREAPEPAAEWEEDDQVSEVAGQAHQLCRNKGDNSDTDQEEKDLEDELLNDDGEEDEV
jgi:hypothetical protein